MKILSFNPGHDGAFAYLEDGHLVISVEAEKQSRYRHSPVSIPDVFNVLGQLKEVPDVLCRGGWWPGDNRLSEQNFIAGYYGVSNTDKIIGQQRLLGKKVKYFSSTHERSHLLCAFGMSNLPKGTPCYALLWEGVIGSFYEIDAALNLIKLADVMPEPGHRYALLYGLADPTFDKSTAEFSRFSDAGKLMALASYSTRSKPSDEEEEIIAFLMQDCLHLKPKECEILSYCRHYNIGLEDQEFRNLAGIFSDRIFDRFFQYAKSNMKRGMPLLISGGCGLNCDWNTKWRETTFFSEVFVPPVANDSGSAIGTAIDAQFHFTGNPKIDWDVYSGLEFVTDGKFDASIFDVYEPNYTMIAEMLANDLVIGWVNGKYEIGPRALGNRSILASPFEEKTRIRLNEIKQREQFRPIAPVCLEEDAERWFGCNHSSPYMLYTQLASTDSLAAVTHVNGTARIQTVSSITNEPLHKLLVSFKKLTGYGVLCNTSLNFKGRGFINSTTELSAYTVEHSLDGFVIEGRAYMLKSSKYYQAYRSIPNPESFLKNKKG
ncbi:MAG: carbamoyltransferase C-terminal domain-containing protein [Chitinophagaceae bacterium]